MRDSRDASCRLLAVALSGLVAAAPLLAQQTDSSAARKQRTDSAASTTLRAVQVRGRADNLIGIASSASQGRIGRADLRLRPLQREGEILEAVPGMILTQHSGDGKANQMVVRGFNLDHGTDFQTRLESMPLNLPTHGHGHGYTYLNPLIPEFVDHLEYKLGPMYAELGDFGSAGGATLHLTRSLLKPVALLESGAFGFRRAVLGAGASTRRNQFIVGGEAKQYDGPWEQPQRLGKFSGLARWTYTGQRDEISVLALGYANKWNATDQIPARAFASGAIGRFGQVDPTLGGDASRNSLSLSWTRTQRRGKLAIDAFVVRHDLNLFSNFTYFLDNAGRGDQINQTDRRTIGGVNLELTRVGIVSGVAHALRTGVQLRGDDIAVGLYRSDRRVRGDTVRRDNIRQGSAGAYASLESHWSPRVRTVLGVRQDWYDFHVQSNDSRNSGTRLATIGSPKASLVFSPVSGTELYLGGGLGFHSNDARGTTIRFDPVSGDPATPVNPLVRSRAAELGLRTSRGEWLRTTASLWALNLDSELLFVGDAGTTEALGGTHRVGVTMANFVKPVSTLSLDTDVSFTRARFADVGRDADRIPGALERVITAGATWEPRRGVHAVARVRHFGSSALTEDNRVRGTPTTLLNLSVGGTIRGTRLTASMLNASNARSSDVQYFYASRLAGESGAGVADVHFHPVEPRMLRVGLSRGF
ncbi:TonB-dependent receptor [Gemmatimonas groenlandica]|uniref:TonB-dependent receptor n=1 Tax=Gemmatimonas groenlandica TaxID=2732249 RepID=A0A6M4IUD3_9BACT|nr:TonB-dependent receptor [Gemmatimonas groenlandica]QJR37096.1 TonB-dependent receptor [Gemmatimonas groenlandica]